MDNVRTIARGIDLLAHLNVVGNASGSAIAAQLGLSRPSTYRLLETLATCGLVRFNRETNRYTLAWPVRTLSSGLNDRNRVMCVATPVLYELQAELIWPTDLAVHENGEMVIHESTHPVSPYSIESGMVGSRHPMLLGSLGRAYLAFCPESERDQILEHFLSRCSGGQSFFETPAQIEFMVNKTRKDGFGSRQRDVNQKTSSIALPIRLGGRVLACMDVSWISSALSFDKAVATFLPSLQAACRTVETRLLQNMVADGGTALDQIGHAA
ncbi:IclR family transcriptional regulator domain-containing protein [Sphingomonas fuzhouensis]|uniref:IclR family transcriptional regulator domain-containing protein n=1 Tax=Sphingomonas fuzhouensis TaxID=3106033 RepID=UPI002AFEBC48|nr:helix-turn-helix domain-containing protein [Sphingomonas sp. SGZ-02]